LLETLVVALRQGVTSLSHAVTHVLSAVVGRLWEAVKHWLRSLLPQEPKGQNGQQQYVEGRQWQQGQRAPAATPG
jgi:hypothetical protein